MKLSDSLINFIVKATISTPDQVDRTGACYLLMGRNFNDI